MTPRSDLKAFATLRSRLRAAFISCAMCGLASSAVVAEQVELTGYVAVKSVDCFDPDLHSHPPRYFVEDDATGVRVELNGYEDLLQGIDPKQKIRVVGVTSPVAAGGASDGSVVQFGSGLMDLEIQEIEWLPLAQGGGSGEEPEIAAGGANSLTMLSTLLVFVSTTDNVCMTAIPAARGLLFDNATNANEGMQAITQGRYGLQLGNGTGVPEDHIIEINLGAPSASFNSSNPDDRNEVMEAAILSKVFGTGPGQLGLNRLAYNRILLFPPFGYNGAGFTAYAYYPYGSYTTHGQVSMYGDSYGDGRMNGYLHELGHNFGFRHSKLPNTDYEYGDRTCVMGLSSDATKTETYNITKLMNTDWLDTFNSNGTPASLDLTQDTTVDLYPLSSDLEVVDETVGVRISGTNYYVAYHRDERPYGYLSQSGDRDKVFVYSNPGLGWMSEQIANLSEKNSFAQGSIEVQFGRMGPSNAYATVSIDVDDGNIVPELTQTVYGTGQNQAVVLAMPSTDADGDSISYVKLTDPSNGVLSGSFPNLIYTPNTDFIGSDTFRITASDALISNFITVTVLTFVDSDTDGLDDDWENLYFGNLSQGPTGNPDLDQEDNLTEFQNGTDPTRAPTVFSTKLSGIMIGTNGSYANNPDYTKDKALDSNLATYYDAANARGDWVGLDFGSPKRLALIKYAGRDGWGFRLEGGMFQVSNTSDFSSGVVTLYTISGWGVTGTLADVPVSPNAAYRYARYIGSDSLDNYNCAAELEFYEDGAPEAPTGLTATSVTGAVDLDWDDNGEADFASYNVYRGTSAGTFDPTPIATGLTSSAYSDTSVVNNTTYYYFVSAVDDDGYQGANSAEASVEYVVNDLAPEVNAGADQTVAMSGEAAWTPALISPTGWYDASDSGTLTLDGSAVTVWADKSLNGLDLAQGDGTRQPQVGINTINGMTTVKFDGSNDNMVTSSNPFTSIEDAFVIMVHRHDGSANATIFNLSGTSENAGRYQAHAPYGSTFYFDAGSTSNRLSATYGASVGDAILMSCYGSTTESKQEVHKNGTLLVSGSNPGTVASPPGNIFIGSSANTQYQNTSIAEAIIINGTVSTEDRQKLEGYLAHKWGLAGNLPEAHPYKAAPPGGAGASADLDGTVFDADGNPMTTTWTKVSGDGSVSFANASAVDTTANFSAAGVYVLRLTADDGVFQTLDEVTITVTAESESDTDGDGMDDAWEIANFGDLTQGPTDDFDGDGDDNLTEFISQTDPTADTVPPAVPTGLAATVGDGQISLDWNDNGEADFNSYRVFRSTSQGTGYTLLVQGLRDSAFVDSSAVNETTYYYVVTAVDNASNQSADSVEVSGTPVGGLLVSGDPRNGGLVYETYANEGQANAVHTVPDFSRAGYGGGGVEIPFVPAAVTLSDDGAADDTVRIQNAINTVSALPLVNGFRGAVLLEAGQYTVSSTLDINASGVVIRGQGQQETGGTTITYTATTQSDLFHFHGSSGPALTGSSTAVTDAYVPVGSKTINVANASTYAPGDLIRITYLMNQQWVDDIGMTVEGGLLGTVDDPEWDPAWFQLRHYRYVESVSGNEITMDAPLVQTIENQYGGAVVQECTYAGAIQNVGIENIRLESTYAAEDDENHGWEAIEMHNVVNGWARQVTARYFGMGLILVDSNSMFITVEDCAMLDPKSITTGGRKYSFQVDDSGCNLVQRCFSRGARHDYATGSVTPGPNVFADSQAVQSNADTGPHFRWATGELYDNIKTDTEINVQNRLNAGTTHGWAGAQIMFWNVDASSIICDAPTGAMNWSIGAVGTKSESPSYMSPWEPFGIWQSHNQHVTPRSLYYAQLEDRLGATALREVIIPEQEAGRIWTALQNWAGDGLFSDAVIIWVATDAILEVDTAISLSSRIRGLNIQENLQSTTWTKASGPGNVLFGSGSSLATTVEFDQQGTYVLHMTADDGSDQVVGSITLEIVDPNYVAPPLAPTNLAATAGNESVSLDWDDNAEANVTYTVMRSLTSGSGYSSVQSGLTTSAYTDNTVTNGTTYFYVVTASLPGSDPSPNSNQQSATSNAAPVFDSGTIVELGATEGQAYSSDLADNAIDDDGDDLTFVKVNGPAWLIVDPSGALSGTPSGADAGLNEWTIEVSDGNGGSAQATLRITVTDVAPAAPSGLQAAAGNNSVSLNWNDNVETDIASYTVYRSTTEGSGYAAIATGLLTSDHVDNTAANGTTYYYVVTVTDDGSNTSAYSSQVSATPEAPSTVNLAATDNAYIRASTPTTIYNVSQEIRAHRSFIFGAREAWVRFPLSGDDEIGGIDIDSVGSVTLELHSNLASSHTIYVFALKDEVQFDGTTLSETTWTGGTAGTEASGANLTTNKRPLGPTAQLPVANQSTGLLGTIATLPAGQVVQITITDLEAFKQLVRDDTNGQITLLLNSNGTDDANSYASVFNTQGKQVPTLVVEQQAGPVAPDAPSSLAATGGNASVSLSWTDNSDNESGFIIQRSTTSGSGFATVTTTTADATSYEDSGLSAGTTYYYQVVATNAGGDSAPTSEASATTYTASEAWRDQFFGQTTNEGTAADDYDFDGDGIPNLLERAFGTAPNNSGSKVSMPEGTMVDDGGTDYPSLTYRRIAGGSGATGVNYTVEGLTYTVEYDIDLEEPWSSGSVVQVGNPVDNGDGTETVTVRLPASVNAEGKQFIRLKVTSAP